MKQNLFYQQEEKLIIHATQNCLRFDSKQKFIYIFGDPETLRVLKVNILVGSGKIQSHILNFFYQFHLRQVSLWEKAPIAIYLLYQKYTKNTMPDRGVSGRFSSVLEKLSRVHDLSQKLQRLDFKEITK